jgi:acetyl-CoA acetyltransferase
MAFENVVVASYGTAVQKIPLAEGEAARSTIGLIGDAARDAFAKAGIDRRQIDALFTHRPPMGDSILLLGQKILAELKIAPTSTTAVMNHGAGMISGLKYGALLLEAGLADYVLCASGDAGAGSAANPVAMNANSEADAHFEAPYDPITPALYGQFAQRYIHERGLTEEDLATVSVAMREKALRHPEAEMRNRGPLTIDQVIASPMIASPSRLLHCAPWHRSSRAGSIILTRAENMGPGPKTYLRAVGEGVTHEHVSGRMGLYGFGPWTDGPNLTVTGAFLAGRQALDFAGLGIDDIDVMETVVPFAFLIPMILEDLGVCDRGEVRDYLRAGGLDRAARVPINTNGGMLSFGQSFLNCVMDQLVEGLQQLDGTAQGDCIEGARRALVHSHGGVIAAHTVAIFERG